MKNSNKKKFIEFLQEKECENSNQLEEGLGSFLWNLGRGIGGAIGGARRGWISGRGSDDFFQSERNLIYRINIALENFKNNLISSGQTKEYSEKKYKLLKSKIPMLLKLTYEYGLFGSPEEPSATGRKYTPEEPSATGRKSTITPEPIDAEIEAETPMLPAPPETPMLPAPKASEPETPKPKTTEIPLLPAPKVTKPAPEPIMGGAIDLKFIQNLNKLILNVNKYFKESGEAMPEKPIFNTLELVRRLYRYSEVPDDPRQRFKKHRQNINHLGNENWRLLISKIVEIFVSKGCNFEDDNFTSEAIETFKNLASRFLPEINYENFRRSITRNANWRNIVLSLSEIARFVEEFCKKNPDLCSSKGKGSAKLLPKLRENQNIGFSDWLIINENTLF